MVNKHFGIIGHSFVARIDDDTLRKEFDGVKLKVVGVRSATSSSLLYEEDFYSLLRHRSISRVFVQLGGNDISRGSSPETIVRNINAVVVELKSMKSMQRIIIGSVFQRFKPRRMTADAYEKQRVVINQKLNEMYEDDPMVTFWFLRGLVNVKEELFHKDGVHLNPTTQKRYTRQIRLALFCQHPK